MYSKRTLALLALMAVIACAHSDLAQSARMPLPFDTAGAGRGAPSNRFESTRDVRWIAGDTLVWARVMANTWPGPQFIELRASESDTSSLRPKSRAPRLAECPFGLRLYTSPNREGRPMWTSARAPHAVACPATSTSSLDVSARFRVEKIMGDSLSPRRYYFRYAVRLASGRILDYSDGEAVLAGKPVPVTHDRSMLRFTSGSEISGGAPRMLTAWTTIKNTGTQAVQFEHGACALQIRLWRTAELTGRPVWVSEARRPIQSKQSKSPIEYACPAILIVTRVLPNDTASFPLSVPLPEVLEDTLPNGHYWVGVHLELLDNSQPAANWGTKYSFPAGELTLRRAPDPPPSVRQEGVLRYEAATRVTRGPTREADSVRTFVLVTNTSDDSADVEVQRDRPLTVYGFWSAEERDAYPTPTPAFTWPTDFRYFLPQQFILGAKKKWLFEEAMAVKDILASRGKHHLFILAQLMGEPIKLAAGDVELNEP